MPIPPSAYRALSILGYAGWAAVLVGLVLFLSGQELRGRDMMMGGAGAIAFKYVGTLLLVLLQRRFSGSAAARREDQRNP